MATPETKPICKFGENCYRKNAQHLKQYRHPKRKHDEVDPQKATVKYKKYSQSSLTDAYMAVKEKNMTVSEASVLYKVPMQTLRDRVLGKISIDTVTSGRAPVLSPEEEAKFVSHLQEVAKNGNTFSRQDVVDFASKYAYELGKRSEDKPFTLNWYAKFAARWKDIEMLHPCANGVTNFRRDFNQAEEESKEKKQKKDEKGKKIEDFFGKKAEAKVHKLSDEESEQSPEETPDREEAEPTASVGGGYDSISESEEEQEEEELEIPESPVDVKENIKQKFLVEMPEDFYHFWEFCKSEKPDSPTDALKKVLGFQLVGPFDILAGKHKGVTVNRFSKRPNFLLHWRYFFDPPEFQTVIKGEDKTQFHLGYFRDDPKESPVFVAANSAKNNSNIATKGDNLFAAVNFYVEEKRKSKDINTAEKSKLKELSESLTNCAEKNGFSMEMKTKSMKARDKKVVCKSFHGAGIVVPVDDNEVGYREVPETPADLKRMFKKIADSKTESERDKNYEDLQELVTLVQFANDECDYGEGLELGMDLFCYGADVLKSTILQLLPLAYMLLGRTEFQKISEAHLRRRSRDSNLSQLE